MRLTIEQEPCGDCDGDGIQLVNCGCGGVDWEGGSHVCEPEDSEQPCPSCVNGMVWPDRVIQVRYGDITGAYLTAVDLFEDIAPDEPVLIVLPPLPSLAAEGTNE